MAFTGLHPFLTSDIVPHEFKILKLNVKIQFSSGHKFLNTGITVIRFTLGIRVSATAYLAWVALLLAYIVIHNIVQFGNEFPPNISFWSLFVVWNTLAFVRNERNSRSLRRTRRKLHLVFSIDRPNGLERNRKVVFLDVSRSKDLWVR